jgi:O-methyltransferase involved in polyketide biosynthesis
MKTPVVDGRMDRNAQQIPYSAMYTSATWLWGKFPCAEIVIPKGATTLFRTVNAYVFLYRLVNPQKFSLKHALVHRHAIIDTLLARSNCRQFIEIASGFSPRGCMVSADKSKRYFEVDLPEVIALKRKQLQGSEAGRAVLSRPNFKLLEGDITGLDFSSHFAEEPTFVISEGIMMYFKRDAQMSIWRNIAQFLQSHGGEYVFDYIALDDEPPRSRLGQLLSELRQWLTKHPPPFAYDDRTRLDVVADLHEAGFARVETIDSGEVSRNWSLPHAEVKTRVITFHCGCT